MSENETDAGALDLVGGELCLDFANTVSNHQTERPNEYLTNYSALVAWGQHAGILSGGAAQRLLQQAGHRPDKAQQVLDRAIALREAIYRIFSAVPAGLAPKADDLAILNEMLADAMPHARIVATDGGFAWDWSRDEGVLDQMLWSIARSAGELLTSPRLSRVRECDGDRCGWLFVDTSKNHSRRWCNMSDCGNRAKARRFYGRKRAAAKPA